MMRRQKSYKLYHPRHSETWLESRHSVQKQSSAVVTGNKPHEEWQRCAEGFQLSSREQTHKDGTDENNTAKHNCGAKSRGQFGQKWIQSEELLGISQSSSQTPRSSPHVSDLKSAVKLNVTCSPAASEDADLDSICWNDSDSDTEDIQKQRILSPPAKRQRTNHLPRKTKQKRNSAKFQNVSAAVKPDFDACDGNESEDEISLSASESEEEKPACIAQGTSHQFCGSRSPVLQIECLGSPEQTSSSTPDDSSHFVIRDPEEGASPWKDAQVPEAATPSISSCASSQRTGDSDVSPGHGGLRASEWARQMKWETTPTKQGPTTPPHQADSGKKRRKFAKGGLAEQMCRILQREKSARSVWQHQHKPEAFTQGAGSKGMMVRVRSLETAYGVRLARCTVMCGPSPVQHSASGQFSVLFSPLSAKQKTVLQEGATVHIYPPWQQVDTSKGKALLCTRYHVSRHSCGRDHSGGETVDADSKASADLSSSPVTSHGRWMCPCSADTSLPATKCPAHLFPFIPSSIIQHTPTTLSCKPSKSGKALHTVTSSDRASKRTLTFNTLLESIEKAPAGDRLLPSFQAAVLRIFHERGEDNSVRQSLLVEDSQGTVAIICGASRLSGLEGRLCFFSCLRVHSRTNADRDPALFSAVCGAWSHRLKTAATSQDSDSVTHSDDCQLISRPPGFCYVLEVDSGARSVLEGEDWLTVSTTPPSTPPPRLLLTSLADAVQSQKQSRITVLGKFLYFSAKRPDKDISEKNGEQTNSQTSSVLYITDHSLQKSCAVDSDDISVKQNKDLVTPPSQGLGDDEHKVPAFVRVDVRRDCVISGIGQENERLKRNRPPLVLLRDVWFVNGSWVADKYSTLTSSETDCAEGVALTERVDPDVHKAVSQCFVMLPALCASSDTESLVSVSGTIQSVDEKAAFSWEECDGCGSDQLATRSGSESLICLSCKKPVSHPVQKMKMEVVVLSDTDPSLTVHISLQQSTIEELLPDEEDEEGYDVDCVLNKAVGPLNCIVTSTTPCATGITVTAFQLPV